MVAIGCEFVNVKYGLNIYYNKEINSRLTFIFINYKLKRYCYYKYIHIQYSFLSTIDWILWPARKHS